MSTLEVNEFQIALDALRRHRRLFAITVFCCIMGTLLPVMLLPSVYKSTATILIESQEIPNELVRSTVTGLVEERIKAITQITLSRANLMAIIERLELYTKERASQTTEEIIESMRADIAMEPIQADVQSATGRPMTATIAFTLSYKGKDPRKVLQTTNTLVSLFLEENYKSREAKAGTTYTFLETQLAELSKEVSDTEAAIARFKEGNLHALPEMVQLNLQNLDRIQREIQIKQELIRSLTDRRIYLEGQLAGIEPNRPVMGTDGKVALSPGEELKSLRNRYISLSGTHSDKHPDMIKLRQQIAALEGVTGGGSASQAADLQRILTSQENILATLRSKYPENHPEVISAEKKVHAAQSKLQAANVRNGGRGSSVSADNPAWVALNAQLKSTTLEIEAEKNNLVQFGKKYDEYLARIESAPKVEQEYLKLQRDYTTSQHKYQETFQKLMSAREAKGLEEQRVGERLTLVDPPILPETPASPNRKLLLAVGMILSIGMGGGVVAARELLDSTIHGVYGITSVAGFPPLVSIPYMETNQERNKRIKQRKFILIACGVALLAMFTVFHFAVMPLDVLAFTLVSRITARF